MTEVAEKIVLTADVQAAIDQVLQTKDSLDHGEFSLRDMNQSPTMYINQLFPNEQSLSNIDDVITKMECEIGVIDDNIRTVVRGQVNTGQEGQRALEDAQKVIQQLFGQITEIKTRAEKTEDMVKEITRDIKQLDSAKKNLTSAITTLNHLHMLLGGVESLTKLAEKRLYGEVLNPLQAIMEVNQHFQQFTEISHIKELSNKVAKIQSELATQITHDFKNAFGNSPSPNKATMTMAQLTDACKVVSVLDPRVKRELLKWFITLQLQEYTQLFHENQDIAWLDKIDKRYAWLKRHLLDFEEKLGNIFPLDWEISERITVQFCAITSTELSNIMAKRKHEMHVKLLLFAVNKTQQFEQLLGKRFTGVTVQETNAPKTDNSTSGTTTAIASTMEGDVKDTSSSMAIIRTPFTDLIGNCFKAHLDIYTDSIDKNLAELLEQFQQHKFSAHEQIAKNSSILTSGADLFVFYKKCLVQCNALSNGKPMYDLAMIFKKYLREYASKCLEQKVPKLTAPTATAHLTANITSSNLLNRENLQNLSTAAGQVLQNFLKEGEALRYTDDDLKQICFILTTSEYCLETVEQLETKLKEKCEAAYAASIDLGEEKDIFHRIISNCIQILVQDLEAGCEYGLTAMTKVQWQNISNVGDQSDFVNAIVKEFKHFMPIIRDHLANSRKYYTQFCLKFTNSFIPRYIQNLFKCRPTVTPVAAAMNGAGSGGGAAHLDNHSSNVLGCEQLLLDTHSLKIVLLDLPSISSQVQRKAPPSYTKIVIKGMTKAEMIIKIVMAPVYPHAAFTEQYLKLLPDSSIQEFQRVLDMKCIRRIDQSHLVEVFKRMAPVEMLQLVHGTESGGDAKRADGGNHSASGSSGAEKGRIKKLENLIKMKIPN